MTCVINPRIDRPHILPLLSHFLDEGLPRSINAWEFVIYVMIDAMDIWFLYCYRKSQSGKTPRFNELDGNVDRRSHCGKYIIDEDGLPRWAVNRFCLQSVSALEAINNLVAVWSGMIWTPHDWLNKFYSFYMGAVVGVVSRRGHSFDAH